MVEPRGGGQRWHPLQGHWPEGDLGSQLLEMNWSGRCGLSWRPPAPKLGCSVYPAFPSPNVLIPILHNILDFPILVATRP